MTQRPKTILFVGFLIATNLSFAMYDTKTGRFMQQDPLGINPAGGKENTFNVKGQYSDGYNLYQYVLSRPTVFIDYMGLWGKDVHYGKTKDWAMEEDYPKKAAKAVAKADNDVDSGGTSPIPIFGDQSYHFNRNLSGGEDTRLRHYRQHYKRAQKACCMPYNDDPKTAAKELGTGLHPYQDWVAHGDYAMQDKGSVWIVHN